ncbi:Mbov_0395 family pilin-like conjugal transfer protein [Patescibacteria group bacterium]
MRRLIKKMAVAGGTVVAYSVGTLSIARAQILNNSLTQEITNETGLGNTDPRETAATIVGAFLGILAVIALVLIISAGFNWMTAAGNEEKIEKAKKTLFSAVIGLIIIMAAYGVSLFVFGILEGATGYQ